MAMTTTTKVSTLSDLIHRVTISSCLTNPLSQCNGQHHSAAADDDDDLAMTEEEEDDDEEEEQRMHSFKSSNESKESGNKDEEEEEKSSSSNAGSGSKVASTETEDLMEEVFVAVAALKRAYVSLQEAHSPWDPEKMKSADEFVVAELRRLGRLKDRFRRGRAGGGRRRASPPQPLREAVAPYEAALEEARREIKVKEAEVENLKEKLKSTTAATAASGKKSRRAGVAPSSAIIIGITAIPTPELFETSVEQVKTFSKSFTSRLISLMRAARWDIPATAQSLIGASAAVGSHHAKHAIESYVTRKLFQGFENETFYMEGSLSSLLNPEQHRRQCYAEFRDMRAMDPAELLGVLPTCRLGTWAGKKYLSILDDKMEESLFGGAEQRTTVSAGGHPRTGFYSEYLRLAKSVWMLHLLAFAMEPGPSHFEASRGAEFQPAYMESVVRFPGGRVPAGWVVGFSVGPGFKLGNGSLVKARVYPVPSE